MSSGPIPPEVYPGPDEDRGASLAAVYISQCAISGIFIALRFWSRMSIQGVSIDDWTMLATWIVYLALTIITGQIALNGGFRHLVYLLAEPENAQFVLKFNYIAQPFGIVAVGLGKIAVALLLLRLLAPNSFWRKWSLWALISITGITTILTAIFTFTQCSIPAALWDPSLRPRARCWDPSVQSNFSIFSSAWNSAVDFVLALFPISLVHNLHMRLEQKIGLCILLGCGVFTGVCASIKTNELVNLASRSDLTWDTFHLYVWASAEIFLVIVCGSIPTLKPLYKAFIKKVRGPSLKPSGYRLKSLEPSDFSGPHKDPYKADFQVSGTESASYAVPFDGSPRAREDIHVTRTFEVGYERANGTYEVV